MKPFQDKNLNWKTPHIKELPAEDVFMMKKDLQSRPFEWENAPKQWSSNWRCLYDDEILPDQNIQNGKRPTTTRFRLEKLVWWWKTSKTEHLKGNTPPTMRFRLKMLVWWWKISRTEHLKWKTPHNNEAPAGYVSMMMKDLRNRTFKREDAPQQQCFGRRCLYDDEKPPKQNIWKGRGPTTTRFWLEMFVW